MTVRKPRHRALCGDGRAGSVPLSRFGSTVCVDRGHLGFWGSKKHTIESHRVLNQACAFSGLTPRGERGAVAWKSPAELRSARVGTTAPSSQRRLGVGPGDQPLRTWSRCWHSHGSATFGMLCDPNPRILLPPGHVCPGLHARTGVHTRRCLASGTTGLCFSAQAWSCLSVGFLGGRTSPRAV